MVMMTDRVSELLAAIDLARALDAGVRTAQDAFHEHLRVEEEKTETRIKAALAGAGDFTVFELTYAERARCRCGAGMAYPEGIGSHGAWYCSAILVGQADREANHEAALPFAFYEIRSESQPEAGTTRPAGTHVETIPNLTCLKCCSQWQGPRHLARAPNREVQKSIVCPKCDERYILPGGSSNGFITSRWHSIVVSDDDPEACSPEMPVISVDRAVDQKLAKPAASENA